MKFLSNIAAKLRRFMYGRYGSDQLNMVILVAGLILNLAAALIRYWPVKTGLMLAAYGLLLWAIFRTLSKKTWKRFDENRKFLAFKERLTDRNHRYYKCPKCRQKIRVPKGKGKISITCPKCKEKFIRKT